ncbi:hypothetical protein Tco_0510070, partial [Tanacetum coccineum]
DIFKIVSIAVRSGTSGESSVWNYDSRRNVIATMHVFPLQALIDDPLNQLP